MKRSEQRRKGRAASVFCRIAGILVLAAVITALLPLTVPRLMGYEIYNVVSGSMEPEIPVDSVIYVKYKDPVTIEDGEIVAFMSGGSVVMHRVVSNHQVESYFTTKGDANEQEDLNNVSYDNVIGTVVKHIPVLGQVMVIYAGFYGKILLFCMALCGALLNVLAGRLQ